MQLSLILDIAVLVVLAGFILFGAHRGFILSLCSLVALLVALVGAGFAADALTPMVADAIEPKLAQIVETRLDKAAEDAIQTPGQDGTPSVQQLIDALREKGGLWSAAADALDKALQESADQTAAQAAASAGAALAADVAHTALYLVSFLLILLLWLLVSHALDLVARLPVLSTLNHLGGAVFGLVKGGLAVFLLAWVLCTLTDLIPAAEVEKTRLLAFFVRHSPLELLMLV